MNNQNLKIFVWNSKQNFFRNYSCGLAVAIAENVDEARKVVLEQLRRNHPVLWDIIENEDQLSVSEKDNAVIEDVHLDLEPTEYPLEISAFLLRGGE